MPLLGDLVRCAPVVAREAREQGKRPNDHYAHLTVHGVLHLLRSNHEHPRDADCMAALEWSILAGLGLSDPYLVACPPPRSSFSRPPVSPVRPLAPLYLPRRHSGRCTACRR